MKCLILIPMCIIFLSGCTTNSQTEGNLIKSGMIETNEQAFYGEKNKLIICENDRDESFSLTFHNIPESTMGVFGYIPVVNFLAPFFMVDTKYQQLSYNGKTMLGKTLYHEHLGVMNIEGNKIDVYMGGFGGNKNAGDLIYLYADNEKLIHAFKTNTGLVPKISSFYKCH